MFEPSGTFASQGNSSEADLHARISFLEAEVARLRHRLSQQDLIEQALLHSQAHLRNILDSLFVYIVVLRPDGTVLKANRAPLELAGLVMNDQVGRHYLQVPWWTCSPEILQQLTEALTRAQSGDASRFDITVTTRTGRPMTLDYMMTPMFDHDGTLVRIVSCSVDISDRIRFERALSESESRFRSTFENAAVGMAQIALSGQWLAVNDKLCDTLGYSRKELVQLSFRELSHPEDRADDLTLPERLLNAGSSPAAIEKRYIRKDGQVVWANVTASPAIRGDGLPDYLIAVVEDITARKEFEIALRESERKFRTLADGIPQLAWMADAAGSIYWYNQRWYDYTGTMPEQMLGWGWQSVHDPAELPRVMKRWTASITSGEPLQMVFPLRSASGEFRSFLTLVLPVRDSHGTIQGWFGTNTDITEQKRTEDALRRSNGDLEQFAYVASHDLQEPIRTVAALTQLLARHAAPRLDEQSREWMEHIVNSSKRMGTLIADLLAYSRATLDDNIAIKVVDCNEVVTGVVEQLHAQIAGCGAEVSSEPLPQVRANALQLGQVFQNLISNALRFGKPGEPTRIRIAANRAGADWQFSVADNGQGFDPAYSERVFGIFKRLHGPEIAGNGIGLAICRTVISRHGGRIWVQTAEGQGATFFFTLPA